MSDALANAKVLGHRRERSDWLRIKKNCTSESSRRETWNVNPMGPCVKTMLDVGAPSGGSNAGVGSGCSVSPIVDLMRAVSSSKVVSAALAASLDRMSANRSSPAVLEDWSPLATSACVTVLLQPRFTGSKTSDIANQTRMCERQILAESVPASGIVALL